MLIILFLWCSTIAAGSNEAQLYQNRINNLITQIVQPQGAVDRNALQELKELGDQISKSGRLKRRTRNQLSHTIALLVEQLPIASKILGLGAGAPALAAYDQTLTTLKKSKSTYAQPLMRLQYKALNTAVQAIKGSPLEAGFDNPHPYDAAYEELINNYIDWAHKLEQLGKRPTPATLRAFSDEFYTQFDRMLTRNDIGRAKKEQLITWLGGKDRYLGTIVGKMITQPVSV